MIMQEKIKVMKKTNSEFVEFVSIPQKLHPFKNPHRLVRLPTEPMGIHHSPHTHTIPMGIPMGIPIPTDHGPNRQEPSRARRGAVGGQLMTTTALHGRTTATAARCFIYNTSCQIRRRLDQKRIDHINAHYLHSAIRTSHRLSL